MKPRTFIGIDRYIVTPLDGEMFLPYQDYFFFMVMSSILRNRTLVCEEIVWAVAA